MDSDGSDLWQLTVPVNKEDPGISFFIQWSPGGEWIYLLKGVYVGSGIPTGPVNAIIKGDAFVVPAKFVDVSYTLSLDETKRSLGVMLLQR